MTMKRVKQSASHPVRALDGSLSLWERVSSPLKNGFERSLPLWGRVGVGAIRGKNSQSALTLTLSQRERGVFQRAARSAVGKKHEVANGVEKEMNLSVASQSSSIHPIANLQKSHQKRTQAKVCRCRQPISEAGIASHEIGAQATARQATPCAIPSENRCEESTSASPSRSFRC
jgi:hypothetical protein